MVTGESGKTHCIKDKCVLYLPGCHCGAEKAAKGSEVQRIDLAKAEESGESEVEALCSKYWEPEHPYTKVVQPTAEEKAERERQRRAHNASQAKYKRNQRAKRNGS